MEKMSRDEIENISRNILENSDVVAKHGTSMEKAFSIMETGFNFHRTSLIVQKNKNIVGLCSYGWKDNKKGDAANIIIGIPKSFYKKLLGYTDEEYSEWIDGIRSQNMEEVLLNSISETVLDAETTIDDNNPLGAHYPIGFNSIIPREFILGAFFYMDNTNYLSFMRNPDQALDHLSYVENPNSYDYLSEQEKEQFIRRMQNKLFGLEIHEQTY